MNALVTNFEYEAGEDRKPLERVSARILPVLGQFMNEVISNKDNSQAMNMLYLILKVFDKCTRIKMSDYLMRGDKLDPWIKCFKIILDFPCPPDL